MIIINKAILHILDYNSGLTLLSDQELPLDGDCHEFLLKHLEKILQRQDAREGFFTAESTCRHQLQAYLQGQLDFVAFSKELAGMLSNALAKAEEMVSADVMMVDCMIEGRRKLVVFKGNSHLGFVHQTSQTEQGIQNDIIYHRAIMPNLTQKMDEFVLIDAETEEIMVSGKKYTIDGEKCDVFAEILLQCTVKPSQKETISKMKAAVKKVAQDYAQDEVAAAAAMKKCLADNLKENESLDPVAVGAEVFADNPAMRNDYQNAMQEAGFTEPVKVNKEAVLKKTQNHKLKTDTGIELVIPTDYFENTEYVEFNTAADGSIMITLKHIQNIANR